jgi:hypothetical protein
LEHTTMVNLKTLLEAFWTCPKIFLFHWWHFFLVKTSCFGTTLLKCQITQNS